MRGFVCIAVGLFCWSASLGRSAPRGDVGNEDHAKVREEALKTVADYVTAYDDYIKALREARTSDDQAKALEKRPKPVPNAVRVMSWAERNPKDPLAADLLATLVRHGSFTREAQKAAEILVRNHLDLQGIQFMETAGEMTEWPMPVAEKWLRAYLEKSPNRQTRARACLDLALYKRWLFERARQEMDADWIEQLEKNFGTGSTDYLKALDTHRLTQDAISLFEQVIDEFGDVEWFGTRLADIARPHHFELSKLAIGKVAPEIDADDLDGMPFRLTQYRGKVVVLTFWATWCRPCMAMVPHERSMVKRFEAKPFVLLGINADQDTETAKRAVQEHDINWRSWWNAGTNDEPISKTWNVCEWPTVYVIDHNGIIRHKNIQGKELEEAVERLLQKIETEDKDQ